MTLDFVVAEALRSGTDRVATSARASAIITGHVAGFQLAAFGSEHVAGKSRAKAIAIAIAKQNRRKRPSGGSCSGYVTFRIMYIMFKTD